MSLNILPESLNGILIVKQKPILACPQSINKIRLLLEVDIANILEMCLFGGYHKIPCSKQAMELAALYVSVE